MISFFRRFFNSKLGVPVSLGFLALIALAFASSDITGTGMFGGVSGGDRVAVVGDEKIGTADLSRAATNALDQMREQNPTLTMAAFLRDGAIDEVLEQLLDRTAIARFAEDIGLRAGDNLLNSEILAIPAFRGPDGNFSDEVYRAAIGQQGLTDAQVRLDLGQGILAQQLLVPSAFGAKMPDKMVSQYASLLKERRTGTIGIVPSALYEPASGPSKAQIQAYYTANRADYIRPERRVIRFATFDASAVAKASEPTEREIAARYETNREMFAARETRRLSQLIVPTQQAANAIRDKVSAGGSLEAAAREAGFALSTVGPIEREALTSQSSAAVATAAFSAAQGAVATTARSGLGWHVIRVDAIERTPGRNLEQARGDLVTALRAEKQRQAIADISASIEEQLDEGVGLADVAKTVSAELTTTPQVTADGRIYGTAGETVPQVLGPVLQTAFQMEEGEPQIAELVPGELFIIFEASDITPSATAPLAEIESQIMADWKRAEGLKRAKAAADRILAALGKGATLTAAMRAENARLTNLDPINLSREQLAATGQRVPPPLALMFSMAQGTSKKLEAPNDSGWFLVQLDRIEAGTIARDDPVFAQAKRELGQTLGQEYAAQLRSALRADVGVERNQAAIDAVRKQLTGEN
ncbi:SurA N-terminal domain-containing protein [Altererythrobacter sp. H2]|uniref:peptidylprolyl isomerase n=1 Tax=Altererythrobacter sp. H2 TaxID=3108391 RepID=UPI002B4BB197|nr:SurA N-terminal domain-containing protein [Altererythrobacter sp. H2]WRK94362.1 SurA N-terminal domain-containing protein [Altererythrobacter sp. H2]